MLRRASHSHFSYSYSSARLELSGHARLHHVTTPSLPTPERRCPHRVLGFSDLGFSHRLGSRRHHCHDLDQSSYSQPENPNGSLGSETVHPHHRSSPNTLLNPHSTPMVSPTISESTPYGARHILRPVTAKASSTFRISILFLIKGSRWREG